MAFIKARAILISRSRSRYGEERARGFYRPRDKILNAFLARRSRFTGYFGKFWTLWKISKNDGRISQMERIIHGEDDARASHSVCRRRRGCARDEKSTWRARALTSCEFIPLNNSAFGGINSVHRRGISGYLRWENQSTIIRPTSHKVRRLPK